MTDKDWSLPDADLPDVEAMFLDAAARLREDPMFGVPDEVRLVLDRHPETVRIVVLGTRGPGSALLDAGSDMPGEVIAAVDDFRCQQGEAYGGAPIISTEAFVALARGQHDLVAVNTCRFDAPKRFFDEVCRLHGIPHLNFEQAVRALRRQGKIDHRLDDWGPHIIRHVPRYQALARSLVDEYSVRTLFSVLCSQLTCEPEYRHEIERPYSTLYFRSGLFRLSDTEKMVDCGASVGESLAGLIGVTKGRFARSWMIEPDRVNIRTLRQMLERYRGTPLESRISLHECAVGEAAARMGFVHGGGHGGTIRADGATDDADWVEVRPIDEIVDEAPTLIKMDVEGAELSALKGARRVIGDHAPRLAVSAYHRATDLLDLTDYVLSLAPGYRVGLRHHTSDRWDTCLYFY